MSDVIKQGLPVDRLRRNQEISLRVLADMDLAEASNVRWETWQDAIKELFEFYNERNEDLEQAYEYYLHEVAARKALEQRIAGLEAALQSLLSIEGDHLCERLHHGKKDRHGIGEPCPVVAKAREALGDE